MTLPEEGVVDSEPCMGEAQECSMSGWQRKDAFESIVAGGHLRLLPRKNEVVVVGWRRRRVDLGHLGF